MALTQPISSNSFFSSQDIINGSSYSEWTKRWWSWFYHAESMQDFEPCLITSNICFLPSNLDDGREPHYLSNTISKDNAILINVAKWMSFGLPFISDDKLRQTSEHRVDVLEKKYVTIDDQVVESQRVTSDVFALEVKRDVINELNRDKNIRKGKYKVVGNGYWLFIKPNTFEKGVHHIHTIASCASGVVNIDLDHEISIV